MCTSEGWKSLIATVQYGLSFPSHPAALLIRINYIVHACGEVEGSDVVPIPNPSFSKKRRNLMTSTTNGWPVCKLASSLGLPL